MNSFRIRKSIYVSLMTAATCVLAPFSISIPLSPVPISLTSLVIYISIFVLGMTKATISYLIYMFIGFIGLPVFSGFSGGAAKIFGPTGGYIIGFIFLSVISGLIIDKYYKNKIICFIGLIIGTIVLYTFGTIWLSKLLSMTFVQGLFAGVIPFIPGDIIKMIIAIIIGPRIKNVIGSV